MATSGLYDEAGNFALPGRPAGQERRRRRHHRGGAGALHGLRLVAGAERRGQFVWRVSPRWRNSASGSAGRSSETAARRGGARIPAPLRYVLRLPLAGAGCAGPLARMVAMSRPIPFPVSSPASPFSPPAHAGAAEPDSAWLHQRPAAAQRCWPSSRTPRPSTSATTTVPSRNSCRNWTTGTQPGAARRRRRRERPAGRLEVPLDPGRPVRHLSLSELQCRIRRTDRGLFLEKTSGSQRVTATCSAKARSATCSSAAPTVNDEPQVAFSGLATARRLSPTWSRCCARTPAASSCCSRAARRLRGPRVQPLRLRRVVFLVAVQGCRWRSAGRGRSTRACRTRRSGRPASAR